MTDKLKPCTRHERRNKLEIYYTILNSIRQESKRVDIIRPTRIQFLSGLSYNVLLNYLKNLKENNLIHRSKEIILTKKGEQFVKEYERLQKLINHLSDDYL
ncbi:MAG: winged helix-turn-helix domain-containing protein [Nitrosotalea sp.]